MIGVAWLSRRIARDMLRIRALGEAAFVDPLTASKRRRFDERLSDEARWARATDLPVGGEELVVIVRGLEGGEVRATVSSGLATLRLGEAAVLRMFAGARSGAGRRKPPTPPPHGAQAVRRARSRGILRR